ncbi:MULTISPECIES: amino acid ABC transporter permease [unclassified Modicisalibacter]|uniref:amino acid ABC transporter permease n=1 Tax=unclassified Modicisalibacter TaxID=2679913 RepID=UPI001CC97D6E|nr:MULTISPECIES: amino acid ABC transporter permease [unclassified Modicisalibacter]MBZ9557983.1 amino acid ABC transporter permease [Modicisalibacter sp. R2A 31.J]MBZ9573349.1 amino acid ABC transporter permease [Modicisalibacter sp. MOD 31.J]
MSSSSTVSTPEQTHRPAQSPPSQGGVQRTKRWVKRHLFPTSFQSLLTLVTLALLAWFVPRALDWLILSATFSGDSQADCLGDGACWLPVTQRIELFVYGFYPDTQTWRVNIAFALSAAIFPLLYLKRIDRRWVLGYLVALPFVMWWLLKGGAGLAEVSSTKFAGILVTVFLGVIGMLFALPIGILLALGRRSSKPAIKLLSVLYIELVRSVPVITLLFMASLMIQLFFPEGFTIDILLRVLIVLIMFTAAYMAETIRGGLQGIPRGQYEAAKALGFSYWKTMGLIILPQVLRNTIPPLLTQFIGLFKETTLVVVVGVLDIVGIAMSTTSAPEWLGLEHEVYLFLAMFFFTICFALSRYARHLEKQLEKSRS